MPDERDPDISFPAMLRGFRVAAGLTQRDLAARSGVSRTTINDLEGGRVRAPQDATIRLLAETLGLDAAERSRLLSTAGGGGRRIPPAIRATALLPNRPRVERRHGLLGRDRELAALAALLRDGGLVTVTGAGGVGKSRLALEAAALRSAEGAAIHVAALETLDTAEAVLAAAAAALGAPPGSTADALAGQLAPGAVLLLDDADHVHAAAPEIAALAAAAPRAAVLVTSRQPLAAPGERVVGLAPFDVGELEGDGDPERLLAHPGVALFLERAEGDAAEEVADVARVVAALDGLPLAIELAAAQTRFLPPAAILRLLESSGAAVLARPGAAPRDRQATMTAAIAWSADRLPEPARALLPVLGAFRGGVALDALEAVLIDLGARRLVRSLPDLIRAGLVHHASADRLAMLEPVRFFAEELLEARPDRREVRLAHARRFARWAARTGAAAVGPRVDGALAAERTDRANALIAARAALDEGEPDLAAAIVIGLFRLWEAAALHHTVAPLVDAVADRADELSDPADRALARFFAAYLAVQLMDPVALRARIAALDAGDAVSRAFGAVALSLTDRPDPASLEPALREARDTLAAAGHPLTWMPAVQLGDAAIRDGRREEGLALLAGVLASMEASGNRFDLPVVLLPMGYTRTDLGRLAEARATLLRDLTVCRDHGFQLAQAQALTAFAEACGRDEDRRLLRAGATLLGAMAAYGERIGVPESAFWRDRRMVTEAYLASRLGAAELARLDAEGRAFSLDEAAALALATAG